MMTLIKIALFPLKIMHKIFRAIGFYWAGLIVWCTEMIILLTGLEIAIFLIFLAPLPIIFAITRTIVRIVKRDNTWTWHGLIRQRKVKTPEEPQNVTPRTRNLEDFQRAVELNRKWEVRA